jgi:hypothetical protein
MFPLSINTWIIVGLSAMALAGFGYGKYEHNRYVTYKTEVEALGKIQEAKVESIKKQQELVTKGVQDEYNAKLALLRQYYSNGVRQPSSSSMSTNGISPKQFDVSTAYSELAGNCAQTTLMLVELQKWLNEQIGIK